MAKADMAKADMAKADMADPAIETALDAIVADWRNVGVLYGGPDPRGKRARPVDLERVLLETTRLMAHMPRLFNTTASWLSTFGDLVAKHRFRRLVADDLAAELQPALGALLDTAQETQKPKEFASIVAHLRPAEKPESIFAVMRGNEVLTTHAKQRTGAIGKRWRVYLIDEPLRPKVLRPASWIMKRHPDFVLRADFKGDLRASVMASLAFDEGAGDSELALARAAGGSRAQVRKALDHLEMTGRVRRDRAKTGSRLTLVKFA
jgi:hypothetical protein